MGELKLDTKLKALIRKHIADWHHGVIYWYPDGLIYLYEETHKYRGREITEKLKYVQRVEEMPEPFFRYGFPSSLPANNNREEFIGRMVFHNPTLLLDGVRKIEIWRNNQTIACQARGIKPQTVVITTLSGVRFYDLHMEGLYGGEITVQNETAQKIDGWG